MLILSKMGSGAQMNPIRIPDERILDTLSKRITRPISGSSRSSEKYDRGRVAFPKYR